MSNAVQRRRTGLSTGSSSTAGAAAAPRCRARPSAATRSRQDCGSEATRRCPCSSSRPRRTSAPCSTSCRHASPTPTMSAPGRWPGPRTATPISSARSPAAFGCDFTINDGPHRYVVQAALAALNRWVTDGMAPPTATPLTMSSTAPPEIARDDLGNALGGVRTPAVDVPVATLSGESPAGASRLCSLFGSTVPFDTGTLVGLYGDRRRVSRRLRAQLGRGHRSGLPPRVRSRRAPGTGAMRGVPLVGCAQPQRAGANRRHVPGTPSSSCSPRSRTRSPTPPLGP